MAVGADSIDDMDVLRHGAMDALFDGIRAQSTLRSFLRAFTDIDSMQSASTGMPTAGSGIGHTKIQGKSRLVRAG
jgi:hypothetical protein